MPEHKRVTAGHEAGWVFSLITKERSRPLLHRATNRGDDPVLVRLG